MHNLNVWFFALKTVFSVDTGDFYGIMAAERTLYRRRCGSDRREDSVISAPCASPGGMACAGHML